MVFPRNAGYGPPRRHQFVRRLPLEVREQVLRHFRNQLSARAARYNNRTNRRARDRQLTRGPYGPARRRR